MEQPLRPEFEARLLKTVERALDARRRRLLAEALLANVDFWAVGLSQAPSHPRTLHTIASSPEAAMSVRAKFYCTERNEKAHAESHVEVVLKPVCRGEDNKSWAKYTPIGEIRMTILNASASDQFKAGEEYYVDFTPAPKGQEG